MLLFCVTVMESVSQAELVEFRFVCSKKYLPTYLAAEKFTFMMSKKMKIGNTSKCGERDDSAE